MSGKVNILKRMNPWAIPAKYSTWICQNDYGATKEGAFDDCGVIWISKLLGE